MDEVVPRPFVEKVVIIFEIQCSNKFSAVLSVEWEKGRTTRHMTTASPRKTVVTGAKSHLAGSSPSVFTDARTPRVLLTPKTGRQPLAITDMSSSHSNPLPHLRPIPTICCLTEFTELITCTRPTPNSSTSSASP